MTAIVLDSALDPALDSAETRWTVQGRAWKQDLPDLPDDVIALLAPPVVVSASAVGHRTSGRAVPRAVAQVA